MKTSANLDKLIKANILAEHYPDYLENVPKEQRTQDLFDNIADKYSNNVVGFFARYPEYDKYNIAMVGYGSNSQKLFNHRESDVKEVKSEEPENNNKMRWDKP